MKWISLSTLLASLAWAVVPAAAAGAAWQSTPAELPGVWDPRLPEDARDGLLQLVALLPEGVDPLRGRATEVLVLPPLREAQVTAVGDARRAERYRGLTRALAELERLPMFPWVDSLERQTAAIRFLESLLAQADAADRPDIERRIAEARAREQTYRAALNQRPPSAMEAAILRRSHRILTAARLSPPPIHVYSREWPGWISRAMNDDFLHIRLMVSPALSEETRWALDELRSLAGGVRYHAGEVLALHPSPPPGLSEQELGFRVRVARREAGDFAVDAYLNFGALRSLRDRGGSAQYLPVSFLADVRGGDRRASSVSMRSSLCFVPRAEGECGLAVRPCAGRRASRGALLGAAADEPPRLDRCAAAFEIGRREGSELYRSLSPAPRDCSVTPATLLAEAHTAVAFLIRQGRFAPIAGLEDVQPCRLDGQSAGIAEAHEQQKSRCRRGDR